MLYKFLAVILVLPMLLLTGCGSAPPQAEPEAVVVAQPEPPQNQEILKALAQLDDIKQELKRIRNTVEELQFDTENAKRRQQDLFQDLDRRLVDIERNQRVLAPQTADGTLIDPATGLPVVEGGSAVGSIDPVTGAATGSETGTTAGTATQVIVAGQQGASTTTTTSDTGTQDTSSQTTAASTGTASTAAVATSDSVSLEEQNAYEQAFEMLKQSRYEDAIMGFQKLVDTWPSSQLADDAYYWMSEARYVNREFEHALSGFRTVVSRFPDSQRVPEALLKVGYIQYDIGAYGDAAETFRDILARFPGHQVTIAAQTRLRRIEQTIQ